MTCPTICRCGRDVPPERMKRVAPGVYACRLCAPFVRGERAGLPDWFLRWRPLVMEAWGGRLAPESSAYDGLDLETAETEALLKVCCEQEVQAVWPEMGGDEMDGYWARHGRYAPPENRALAARQRRRKRRALEVLRDRRFPERDLAAVLWLRECQADLALGGDSLWDLLGFEAEPPHWSIATLARRAGIP